MKQYQREQQNFDPHQHSKIIIYEFDNHVEKNGKLYQNKRYKSPECIVIIHIFL